MLATDLSIFAKTPSKGAIDNATELALWQEVWGNKSIPLSFVSNVTAHVVYYALVDEVESL